jgi:hypothetical protein
MTDAESKATSRWPKVLLWLAVITFGIFYLDAIRERGAEQRSAQQAQSRETPAVEAAGTEHADRIAGRPAAETASTLSQTPSVATPGAQLANASRPMPSAAEDPSKVTPPAHTEGGDAPSASVESATHMATAARPRSDASTADAPADTNVTAAERRTPRIEASQALPPGPPVHSSIAARRARLIAEYESLVRSVETERRQAWEQMNRLHWSATRSRAYPAPPALDVPYPEPRHRDYWPQP